MQSNTAGSVRLLLLALALAACSKSDTGSIPKLAPGTPYSDARPIVLKNGWTPVKDPQNGEHVDDGLWNPH